MRFNYLTVPSDLQECAEDIAAHLKTYGYRVVREPKAQVGLPYMPALRCSHPQDHRTLYVEVDNKIPGERLKTWAMYCKSCPEDTRIALAMPSTGRRRVQEEDRLRELGVGLFTTGPEGITQVIPAADVAVNFEPPPLKDLHPRVRALLGPAYESWDSGNWREGFERACQAFEVEARAYLADGVRRGRVTFTSGKGKAMTYSRARIAKMPMGALAKAFTEITTVNHYDQRIAQVLIAVNPDRVAVVHHRRRAATERRLRRNVGTHMWKLVEGIEMALGVTRKRR